MFRSRSLENKHTAEFTAFAGMEQMSYPGKSCFPFEFYYLSFQSTPTMS
jgi:hypothetical protein